MGRKKPANEDLSLQTLLDLDGEIFPMESGYWTKFEVCRVDPTPEIPHGIRYSLTLHDRNNTRVLGFDNAHAFKPRKKRYGGRKIAWDHQHKRDRTYPYGFDAASNLIEDFWAAVEEITG
jgi:hypothetical protein